ncbi:MAG TPA: glycosyltransferase family 39 protein [Thermoanaerobaculia bacterium]|nr:glycosyltransferase family 39 protein [Thermoanaerobaculia bacterium]
MNARPAIALDARLAKPSRLGESLRLRGDLLALAVSAVAVVALLAAAWNRALSPDETLQIGLANVPGFSDVYRSSQSNAHPPLFFFLLRFWLSLGRSELFLRLFPALCGGAFLWFTYRWAARILGSGAGVMALAAAALSPALIPLSAELRGYSLLLLLSAASLDQFESALGARSAARMALSSVLLYLAVLTHYAGVFVVLALFFYACARLWKARPPRRVIATWAVFQVGAAALCLFLYLTQVARLWGGALESEAMTGWLEASYFHPGRDGAIWFVVRQMAEIFLYLFGSPIGAIVAFLAAGAGVVRLVRERRPEGLLIVLPFLLGAAAGLLGRYPFGGTRHSAYLLPFTAAAIGAAFRKPRFRGWPALLPVLVLAPLPLGTSAWSKPGASRPSLNAAVERIRRAAPEGSVLFADHRTASVLSFYLDRGGFNNERQGMGQFREREAGGYCVIRSPLWTTDPNAFADEIERLTRAYRFPPGQRLWAIRFGGDMTLTLARRFPGSAYPVMSRLAGLSVVEIWPPDESGAALFGTADPGKGRETR